MRQNQTVEKIYQKKSQLEHILLRPQMYVGEISLVNQPMWILSECRTKFVNRKIQYCPGLYKIFDEILVNAADNFQRDHRMKRIQVTIDKTKGISVLNDGQSIPIVIHKEHKIQVTELIFGHLLTGSNYQDNDKKVTGGRNGYGAKLANIFSNKFEVEVGDAQHQKELTIKWTDNMTKMQEPVIKNVSDIDNYTKVTFTPDYKRFGIRQLSSDMLQLMKKRVYDLAGTVKVKVYLNGQLIKIKSFEEYISYYTDKSQTTIILQSSKRWKVIVDCSQAQFQQVSFVNSICTYRGGTHINSIMDQIAQRIIEHLKKKVKNIEVKPAQVKTFFFLFINCLIENPVFDTQTKENLVSKPSTYGSEFVLSEKSVKEILSSGVVQRIIASVKSKQGIKLSKQLKKKKGDRLIISKLQDANSAGKGQHNCTLILTQGDSAKSLAMCGLGVIGRDRYGVFPLKGKILNVNDVGLKQVADNDELKNIVQIVGLEFNKVYHSTKELRYQSIMIMADQDHDGSHIKGLILNFFATFWPSLCKQDGFLKQFITPIIKCKKADQTLSFFNQVDYQKWTNQNNTSGWKIKYYKGLGTSTAAEAKQYFTNMKKHQITFTFEGNCFKDLDMAFNKKLAHLRKQWIEKIDVNKVVDHTKKLLTVSNFVNLELIHFSQANNARSIPSIVDGLKPSQRKILFSCFKRNLKNQIKVAQLSGYVAQHSAYHHGQMSLNMTIIGMAQNFVGSNNLNLLMPVGQFGTRSEGGSDSASARYIFTQLNPLTRLLFHEDDDHIVDYIQEENQMIEPEYYFPILPLVLINGAEGIGMGWSTTIYPFKVRDVIKMIKKKITQGQFWVPSIGWENFKGDIQQSGKGKYTVKGVYEVQDNVVTITELPIKKWTSDYKSFLESKVQTSQNKQAEIEDIKEYHSLTDVNFVVTFVPQRFPDNIQKALKLTKNVENSNNVLFDSSYHLRKYETIEQIINQFYDARLKAYEKRKRYLFSKALRQRDICQQKHRFIEEVANGTFSLKGKKEDWIKSLQKNKYKSFQEFPKVVSTKLGKAQEESNNDTADYNYLLNLPLWSFSKDKLIELQDNISALNIQLKEYDSMGVKDMWLKDITVFENMWIQLNPKSKQSKQPSKSNKNIVNENNISKSKKPSPVESAKECVQIEDSDEEVFVKRVRKKKMTIEQPISIEQQNPQQQVINIDSQSKLKSNSSSVKIIKNNCKMIVQNPSQKSTKKMDVQEPKQIKISPAPTIVPSLDLLFMKYMSPQLQSGSKPHPTLLQEQKQDQK